jgi:hypothetical protein
MVKVAFISVDCLLRTEMQVLRLRYASLRMTKHRRKKGKTFLIASEERYRLDSCYLESLAAADVFAAYEIVAADHVALGLGEAGAIALVGSAGDLGLLSAYHPAELVLGLLAAVRAGHRVSALFGALVEKFTLFHPAPRRDAVVIGRRIPCSPAVTGPFEEVLHNRRVLRSRVGEANGPGMSRPKKQVFSRVKAAKSNARDRVGTPPPERVLPDPKQKRTEKPKHKETLADLMNKTGEEE